MKVPVIQFLSEACLRGIGAFLPGTYRRCGQFMVHAYPRLRGHRYPQTAQSMIVS